MAVPLLSLLGLATTALAATTSSSALLHNPLPTAIPVSTQTHFNAPSCTSAAGSEQSLTVNYNFETVERFAQTSPLTPIDEYNLLNFMNINAVNTDPDFDGNHLGLAPHTYPNAATFSFGTALLNTLTGSTPVITANYTESTIKSFTPASWWYGCVLPSPYTAGSLPSNCTITAQGYDYSGAKVGAAMRQFVFRTNGSNIQDQNFGAFGDGFAGIYSLAFSVDNAVSAALVDNFVATITQDSCAPYYTGSYEDGT
ncbi:hypothetical protein LTR85_001135 [Meristemomyces frigidus]|nr:hypothetical protein LTR85_001135 [Meristemomyces frigidus]